MPRLAILAFFVALSAVLVVPLLLTAAIGLPVVVAGVVGALAASHAYLQMPEAKSQVEQMPRTLTVLFVAAGVLALLAPIPVPQVRGGVPWFVRAPEALVGEFVVAVAAVPVGWVAGGLLPGSGWHRAGRPWRRGE